MSINTQSILVTLASLIIGLAGGYIIAGQHPALGEHVMSDGSVMHDSSMSMDSAMEDMMSALKGKTGDDFDKAFLSEMIVHHEGAVDMAEAALADARHDEIKQLARDIIDAQTKEIGQMRMWQQSWYRDSR